MLQEPTLTAPLQVAVGIVKNAQGQVLVALRPKHVHQGGLWEFPGGKVNANESVAEALERELLEELGIIVEASSPLICIRHQYPDLCVHLNVSTIDTFSGEAWGCEGQEIQWVNPEDLKLLDFPAANIPIITAATLPEFYAILDDSILDKNTPAEAIIGHLLAYLQRLLRKGIKLIQIRLKHLSADLVGEFITLAQIQCNIHEAKLLINSVLTNELSGKFGVHLTSHDLMRLKARPGCKGWVAASCHNQKQLEHAAAIGVDFVVLAPVLPTTTHPGSKTLGWSGFAELVAQINLPVYALGGMRLTDLTQAKILGAQGLAGIRLFLD